LKPCVVVDIVGLTLRQLGEHTPNLSEFCARGTRAPLTSVLPAVTCSAQATMLTGALPAEHGAVGNGWFDRDNAEVALWRQSNALVRGKKVYELGRERDSSFTCAKLFWWWNMGAAVDWSITPRPFYPADGRKIPAVYGWPRSYPSELEKRLGAFPFFDFWGPKSGLPSSRWIADAAIATLELHRPTLTLVYLPHLDYSHQQFGPQDSRSRAALREIDVVFGDLLRAARSADASVLVVSEYGLEAVDTPIDINRVLRRAGLLEVRETPAGEVLDVFGSAAFAVADHQVAHVYARSEEARQHATNVLRNTPGVAEVLDRAAQRRFGLDHARSGDLVAVARKGAWFTYYYWLDDERAPDFARTVDIHRKPGYDPCELFLDPALRAPKLRIALRLAQKLAGQRYLMDVIPLDARLVKGSHGRLVEDPLDGPLLLSDEALAASERARDGSLPMTSVSERILARIFGRGA
jgi:predicted AlkP superfamily pyrophosphatase or phosphodiesterase